MRARGIDGKRAFGRPWLVVAKRASPVVWEEARLSEVVRTAITGWGSTLIQEPELLDPSESELRDSRIVARFPEPECCSPGPEREDSVVPDTEKLVTESAWDDIVNCCQEDMKRIKK